MPSLGVRSPWFALCTLLACHWRGATHLYTISRTDKWGKKYTSRRLWWRAYGITDDTAFNSKEWISKTSKPFWLYKTVRIMYYYRVQLCLPYKYYIFNYWRYLDWIGFQKLQNHFGFTRQFALCTLLACHWRGATHLYTCSLVVGSYARLLWIAILYGLVRHNITM